VTHLHGGHVEARYDGQPELHLMPGESDVYEYPNDQLPATLWYHDHALGITRLNVYMGLAAFYILRDDFEDALGLPVGAHEVPLVLQDREFNDDGSFFYPPTIQDAFFGDKVLVNGKVWPYLDVDQGKYRFRFLNGSQARTYRLRLENLADPAQVIPFQLIGTDGGLIGAPIQMDDFVMAPAERFDVVVDFAGFASGTEIVLRNDAGGTPQVPNVMKFVVGPDGGHLTPLPATLRPVPPIDPTNVPTRHFQLDKIDEPCAGQEWIIRSVDGPGGTELGKHWDDLTERPVLGTTEIWEFENLSNMMHPMHVHLVMFQVLERRNGAGVSQALEPWEETTWKDTVRVPPRGSVRIIMTFEDYAGRFAYHCHILDHEDHEMMRQFQATHDPALCDGDGTCDPGEDCVSCPSDCLTTSGAYCGDGLCEVGDGENYDNCPADCAGKPNGKNAFKCGDPANPDYVGCDDERCSSGDFYCRSMPRLVACCGDGLCEGQEQVSGPDYCAVDCDPTPPPPCSVTEDPEVTCDDGLDNDCDGAVDGADADCPAVGDCSQHATRDTCNADPACEWQGSPKNGSCVPAGCTVTEDPETTCDDGADNDCDGLVDGDDPDCVPPTCDDDGVCEVGEDCLGCPGDCAGVTSGKPADRYCCGDGVSDPAEGDGTICDDNH
jgi:spore coat protein A